MKHTYNITKYPNYKKQISLNIKVLMSSKQDKIELLPCGEKKRKEWKTQCGEFFLRLCPTDQGRSSITATFGYKLR